MPGLSMKGKQPLAELLVELIKQLEKTNRQIEALAGQNKAGPAKAASGPSSSPSQQPNNNADADAAAVASQNATAAATEASAATSAENVTMSTVTEAEDESDDEDLLAGNVLAEDENVVDVDALTGDEDVAAATGLAADEEESVVGLSPPADTEDSTSYVDFLQGDEDSDEDVFDSYQVLVDGKEEAQSSQNVPAPDDDFGSSGPSFGGGAAAG